MSDDHEALLQFLYLAPVGLIQASIDGDVAMINPVSAQLLMPLSRDAGLTNLFDALESVAPDLRDRVAGFVRRDGMVCDAMPIRLSSRTDDRGGPQVLSLSLLKLDDHRLMAVLTDITQQMLRERLFRQNETWLHAVLAGVRDYAIVRLDHEGRIVDWNASIERITGFDRRSVVGQPFSIFYPDGATTPDRMLDRLYEARESGSSLDDGWRARADGTRFWGSALFSPLRDRADLEAIDGVGAVATDDEEAYCLVIRDITDKREANELHRRTTACDLLTGIANRRAFYEAAETELARCRWSPRPLSVIRVDADAFDAVVEAHGRAAGDAMLLQLVGCMDAVLREVDVRARIGREAFAVLLPSTDLRGAVAVGERLRAAVAGRTSGVDGAGVRLSFSGGVAAVDGATVDDEPIALDALLQRADRALAEAKAAGGDRIECWSPVVHDALV